ncbi:hypothetical protein K438DRAFT_1769000 [Mycena galopus ATCC 62051]|nr:hypothetical protein K438DRAFT_1769000 [Mycena galopus ATCC 62051]
MVNADTQEEGREKWMDDIRGSGRKRTESQRTSIEFDIDQYQSAQDIRSVEFGSWREFLVYGMLQVEISGVNRKVRVWVGNERDNPTATDLIGVLNMRYPGASTRMWVYRPTSSVNVSMGEKASQKYEWDVRVKGRWDRRRAESEGRISARERGASRRDIQFYG